ncbi:hypothetical protein [Candidatus Amarobacter glycogenicus]
MAMPAQAQKPEDDDQMQEEPRHDAQAAERPRFQVLMSQAP